MGAETRLLYDERPLVVIPELAKLLATQKGFDGLQEALDLRGEEAARAAEAGGLRKKALWEEEGEL